jgi:hypothetical protein
MKNEAIAMMVAAAAALSAGRATTEAQRCRNADAAGTHSSALVTSCVQCHAVVRRTRLVSTTSGIRP